MFILYMKSSFLLIIQFDLYQIIYFLKIQLNEDFDLTESVSQLSYTQ